MSCAHGIRIAGLQLLGIAGPSLKQAPPGTIFRTRGLAFWDAPPCDEVISLAPRSLPETDRCLTSLTRNGGTGSCNSFWICFGIFHATRISRTCRTRSGARDLRRSFGLLWHSRFFGSRVRRRTGRVTKARRISPSGGLPNLRLTSRRVVILRAA